VNAARPQTLAELERVSSQIVAPDSGGQQSRSGPPKAPKSTGMRARRVSGWTCRACRPWTEAPPPAKSQGTPRGRADGHLAAQLSVPPEIDAALASIRQAAARVAGVRGCPAAEGAELPSALPAGPTATTTRTAQNPSAI